MLFLSLAETVFFGDFRLLVVGQDIAEAETRNKNRDFDAVAEGIIVSMAPLDFVFGLETRHEVVDVIHFVDTKGIFVAIIDNKGHALCVVDIFHVVHQGAVYRILYCTLEAALADLRGCDHPVVLHVHTEKGHGFDPAVTDPEGWHHASSFDLAAGIAPSAEDVSDYAQITGEHLIERMEAGRDDLVMVSAAMPYVMGFTPELRERAGERFVDVGIAEEHAVTYVTALASAGYKPVLGIYGTFLQRAYDELWHDLCLNAAPAVILVFGASAFGATDATHLGFFDIPMLGAMPGLPYLAPTCREEYLEMLDWALDRREGPVAIRVPGAGVVSRPGFARAASYASGSEIVRRGSEVALLALGDLFPLGEKVADALADSGVRATLVNPRLATTADEDLLGRLAAGHRVIVTLEDGILDGGFGERCARALATNDAHVLCYGLPRAFPARYDPAALMKSCGMTVDGIVGDALESLRA